MKFKCWCTYAPSSLGLTTASTHLLAYGLWSVLCPTTVLTVSPPSAQSPFAPRRCDPAGKTQLPSPQRTLLLLPRSYGLIRPSQRPLLYFGLCPRWRSLRRLSPVPAARRTFPTLSPRIFPWMLDRLPRRSHSVPLPVSSAVSSAFPTRSWVGFPRNSPLETTSCGRLISGRQIFLYVPASNFVLPPRSSLPLHLLLQGSRGFYVRAERASFTSARTGYANRPNQAIDGTRTLTSLDPRPCRPLPPHRAGLPDSRPPPSDHAVSKHR